MRAALPPCCGEQSRFSSEVPACPPCRGRASGLLSPRPPAGRSLAVSLWGPSPRHSVRSAGSHRGDFLVVAAWAVPRNRASAFQCGHRLWGHPAPIQLAASCQHFGGFLKPELLMGIFKHFHSCSIWSAGGRRRMCHLDQTSGESHFPGAPGFAIRGAPPPPPPGWPVEWRRE